MLSLERGTLRLTQLIDNLLESVRIESGQLASASRAWSSREVVEDAQRADGLAAAPARPATARGAAAEDLPPSSGDKPRLTQVFVNLIANANKFAPEGSSVRIGARRRGDAFVTPGSRMKARACREATASTIFDASGAAGCRSRSPAASASDCGSSSPSSTATAAQIAAASAPREQRTRFSIHAAGGESLNENSDRR